MSGDAGGEIEAMTEREREREWECSGLVFDLLHSSGRHGGTLHLISQTLIRPDLGSQHYKTAFGFKRKRSRVIACEGSGGYSSHKHYLREMKFELEGRLIWSEESVPAKKPQKREAAYWNLMSFVRRLGSPPAPR